MARAALLLLALVALAAAINNGVGRTPAMGWNTWCTESFECSDDYCTETEVMAVADGTPLLVDIIYGEQRHASRSDDCWAGPRDANGDLTAETSRFPSGTLVPLANYLHSKGFKFGVYLDAGNVTCKFHRPGSGGHFVQDANLLANWTVDYVKMDWCDHPDLPPPVVYGQMRDALNATGRPMFFETCDWGEDDPWTWGLSVANSWRIHEDHLPLWWGSQGTANIIESFANKSSFAGLQPDGNVGWNYGDFLMTGMPLYSSIDAQTEFAIWALVGSPLIIASNVRDFKQTELDIVTNSEVIAVSQDPLGKCGDRIWKGPSNDSVEIWARPLHDGSYAVIVYNPAPFLPTVASVSSWSILGWPSGTTARVRDILKHKELGNLATYSTLLLAHAVSMLQVWQN